MCSNGVFKDDHNHPQTKGLTYTMNIVTKLYPDWIIYILSWVHD